MEQLLNETLWGNTVQQYVIAAGIFVAGLIVITIFKKIILHKLKKWAEKTKTTVDDFIILGIQKSVVPLLYFAALYIAVKTLKLNETANEVIGIAAIVIITFFAVRLITSIINYGLNSYIEQQKEGDERGKQLKGLSALVSAVIWGLGIMFLLDNLGIEISAVIAGLGIGGIAVALAAQTVLGDLFSYFVIFFDRPFELGDFIVVGDKLGSVEHIGIKTTRLRALGGEQLVFSNTDLTDSRIHNFKKMQKRRVVFKLGVIYETELDALKKVPEIVQKAIEETDNTQFDRGHFFSFGGSSLDFEFVYYVISSDYTKYMDIQQAINYKLFEEFKKEGLEFAYPTQTLYVNKMESEYSSKEAA